MTWTHEEFNEMLDSARASSVKWAREVLDTKDDWVILDTETTGLSKTAQAIEIAVIGLDENVLLNSLVKPVGEFEIDPEAEAVHGISQSQVENAPDFAALHPVVAEVMGDRKILIYNARFDMRILSYSCQLAGLPDLIRRDKWHCLMYAYAAWYGEWVERRKSFKWQPLGGGHRALEDCLEALECLREMAADEFGR